MSHHLQDSRGLLVKPGADTKSDEFGDFREQDTRADDWDTFDLGKVRLDFVNGGYGAWLYFKVNIRFGTDLFQGKIHEFNVDASPVRIDRDDGLDITVPDDCYSHLYSRMVSVEGLGSKNVKITLALVYDKTGYEGQSTYRAWWQIDGGFGKPYESKVENQIVWF